jgi:4-O-beta-D-mannosyl-D-glucose phosphorylase
MDSKLPNNSNKKIPNYQSLLEKYNDLINKTNLPLDFSNGIFDRYKNPVITAAHIPINWRYDLNPDTNPLGLERIGINSTFNPGAIKWKDKYVLAVRVEGNDRKSFFAMAESPNGIDNFKFWEKPIVLPQTEEPETNVYDIRRLLHRKKRQKKTSSTNGCNR